jgi:Fe2+ or Zn2+ uptake regulation protein
MCVIVAKKIKGSWKLFKFRDRKYDPKYIIKDYNVNNIEITYLKDKKTNWIEGINSNGITFVSAALDNHSDASITDQAQSKNTKAERLFKEYLKKANQRNFEILKRALRQSTIEDALEILVESKFIGNTFLTDGEKLYSIEIAIPQAKLLKYRQTDDFKNLSFKEFKAKIMNNLNENDFKVSVIDASNKRLLVKTNHSIQLSNLGYIKGQKGYESSVKRRELMISFLKNLDNNLSVEEIIYELTNLDLPKVHKNPENRPLRTKEKINLNNNEKEKLKISNYYTTDIFGIDPEKRTIYILPLHSKILNYNEFLQKETQNHIVVLNKNIFKESWKETINKLSLL